jgi:hypothetical protein
MKTVRRSFAGIQFTRHQDGYMRPGDCIPHWVSVSGIKLFCGAAIRGPLDDNWEVSLPDGTRASGFTAEDALQNVGVLPR